MHNLEIRMITCMDSSRIGSKEIDAFRIAGDSFSKKIYQDPLG